MVSDDGWTPGPWHVETIVEDEDEPLIYGVCHPATVCNATTVCNVFSQADARLIATAPELVEALEKIVAGNFNCSPHQRFTAAQGVAERALAKAKGQSS